MSCGAAAKPKAGLPTAMDGPADMLILDAGGRTTRLNE
jgi:hypothetical protein